MLAGAAWEVIDVDADLWSCPDCLTVEEQQAIDEFAMETMEVMSECSRCRRTYDELADLYEEDFLFPYTDHDGWFICPRCLTHDEAMAELHKLTEGLHRFQISDAALRMSRTSDAEIWDELRNEYP